MAILLLVAVFNSYTELHEWLKLPNLVLHYFEHRHDHDESFADFLEEHYGHDHQKSDHQEHQNLPFKDQCASLHIQIAGPEMHSMTIAEPELFCNSKQFSKEVPAFSAGALSAIWQPPRHV